MILGILLNGQTVKAAKLVEVTSTVDARTDALTDALTDSTPSPTYSLTHPLLSLLFTITVHHEEREAGGVSTAAGGGFPRGDGRLVSGLILGPAARLQPGE